MCDQFLSGANTNPSSNSTFFAGLMLSIFDPDKIGSSKLIEMYMDEVKKLLGDLGEDIKKRGGGFFKGGDKVV